MSPLRERFTSGSATVLVVDPGRSLEAALPALRSQDIQVWLADSVQDALEMTRKTPFDCVVSGLSPPELDGMELLRSIRAIDSDLPVVLVTGHPSVESAAQAVEWGAFRYWTAPVVPDQLVETIRLAARANRLARLRCAAYQYLERIGLRGGNLPGAGARFEAALSQVWMAFQPIVSWPEHRVVGYEALVRSRDPVLSRPQALIEAAEGLGRIHDLGRAIRNAVAEVADGAHSQVDLFVNLHAQDLLDPSLYAATSPLSVMASRVVLEITERVSLDLIDGVQERVARLRRLGYRIAIDDLGAGYASLSSLAQLEPDVVKLDMALTRNVHLEPTRRALVQSLASVCQQMNVSMVAEGVESEAERDGLASAGCGLFQGFLFGLPHPGLPEVVAGPSAKRVRDEVLEAS